MYEEIKETNIVGNSKGMGSFSENLVSYSMMLVGYLTAKYFEERTIRRMITKVTKDNQVKYAALFNDANAVLGIDSTDAFTGAIPGLRGSDGNDSRLYRPL